ncbi:MAG: hypothetical protein H6707_05540 [Deltaproteobacteria bacterium]|nr:hypothetical protein [Deltaproteobacteria bacterium]
MQNEFWSIHAVLPAGPAERFYHSLLSLALDETPDAVVLSGKQFAELEDCSHRFEIIRSVGQPALAALEQQAALPHGVPLLSGRPFAWIPAESTAWLESRWRRLLVSAGGIRGLVQLVAPYFGQGDPCAVDVAYEEVVAVERTLAALRGERFHALLICVGDVS